jgi:hypothetical protein
MNRAQVGSETAPAMRRTEHILCLSFILKLLLPVSSLHYLAVNLPGNIPGHCRLLRVPSVMRTAVQHSLPQAAGFRCAHCTSEFNTRHAMDCHRQKQSSLGTGCADPINSKSVFFTGRASFESSIVRENDILGAHTNHTEAVCVHRQLLQSTFIQHKHRSINIICIISIIDIILI